MLSTTNLKHITAVLALTALSACNGESITQDVNSETDEIGKITIKITDDIQANQTSSYNEATNTPQENLEQTSEATVTTNENSSDETAPDEVDNSDNTTEDIDTDIPSEAMPVITSSGHYIQSVYDQALCLGISATDTDLPIRVTLQECQDDDKQHWHFEEEGKIINASQLNLCLGFEDLIAFSSLNLQACDSEFTSWQVSSALISQQEIAIDVDRGDNSVIAYQLHGGENQQWIIGEILETNPLNDVNLIDEELVNDIEVIESTPATGVDHTTDEQIDHSAFIRLHSDTPWTFLAMDVDSDYGEHTITVPAAQNWVNTGLYLTAGQSVTISATGQWQVAKNTELHGADGTGVIIERGCIRGSLVARVGLYYNDENIGCIGSNGTFTASKDGIVYVAGIVGNDLGETYETRVQAKGELTVTLKSAGKRVPTILAEDAASYNFLDIESGWVEVLGEHNIVTLPTEIATQDASEIFDALTRLDDIYRAHTELRGAQPYHGQPIRWFADTEDAPGWMLAGNPVRLDPRLVYADNSDRISRAARAENGNWGFAHELGHDFNFVGGDWYYTTSGGLEAWPNIFTVHAQETLNLPARDNNCVNRKASYLSSGTYADDFSKDVWLSLCFFLEFKDQYGWQFYKDFYQEFNQSPGHGWSFLRARFSNAAGEDVNPIFDEWKIPQQ